MDKTSGHRDRMSRHHVGWFALAQTLPNRIHKFHIYLNHLVSSVKMSCTWAFVCVCVCSMCEMAPFHHVQRSYATAAAAAAEPTFGTILDLKHGTFYNSDTVCMNLCHY